MKETKLHMVTVNGRTVFVRIDKSVKVLRITETELERLFGIKPGMAVWWA